MRSEAWIVAYDLDLPRLEDDGVHTIELDGLEARFLRTECDAQHPMPPSMGDLWADYKQRAL